MRFRTNCSIICGTYRAILESTAWCGRGTMVGPRVLIAVEFVKQEKLGQRQEDLDQMRNF